MPTEQIHDTTLRSEAPAFPASRAEDPMDILMLLLVAGLALLSWALVRLCEKV
jgi:hypothetical protein